MELLNALGLDWKILFAQFLNFALLFFLLQKFALGKILMLMEKRQKEINTGLDNAQRAKEALNQAELQQTAIITDARAKAGSIIGEARQMGKIAQEQIVAQAKQEALKIINNGEKQVAIEQEKMILEVKKELADIISLGVKAVSEQQIAPEQITSSYLNQGLKA